MLTTLQTIKQTHYFQLVDIDNNGYIDKSDWVQIGDNLAVMRNIEKGSEAYLGIQAAMDSIWTNLSSHADANSDGKVTLDEWLAFEDEKVINCDDEWYEEYVNTIVRGLFAVLDADQNGVIGLEEYVNLMVSFHVQPTDAELAFRKLDVNGNGTIDEEELVNAVFEFHRSDEQDTPGNYLFGPYNN